MWIVGAGVLVDIEHPHILHGSKRKPTPRPHVTGTDADNLFR
jgi:hypothetical protein